MQLSFKVWKEEPNLNNEYFEITYVQHLTRKSPQWVISNEKGQGGKITEGELYDFLNTYFKEAI